MCDSIVGAVCCAPLLMIGTCLLLGWNEKHSVCMARAIDAGEHQVTGVGCTDWRNQCGKLVLASCDIDAATLPYMSPGANTDFAAFKVQATGLAIKTEMY